MENIRAQRRIKCFNMMIVCAIISFILTFPLALQNLYSKNLYNLKVFWIIGATEICIAIFAILWLIQSPIVIGQASNVFSTVCYLQFLMFWFGIILYIYLTNWEGTERAIKIAQFVLEDICLMFMAPNACISFFVYLSIIWRQQMTQEKDKSEKEAANKKEEERKKSDKKHL